jgi:hypothetical protein
VGFGKTASSAIGASSLPRTGVLRVPEPVPLTHDPDVKSAGLS